MSSPLACDLILLSWNHLEQTRPCLESLFESTAVPCRLLIVDNASEPPVREYLSSVKPKGAIREVIVLQNERNEGFSAGMNRGVQESTAPFVCLLNNDLLFTKGWLEEMLAVAEKDVTIGAVNPASSTFGERPRAGESLEAVAGRRRALQAQYTEVGMGIGFCLLIKREVINRIGGLTKEVDRAFFEDEDYSARIQQAGLRCVVAEGAYVYHTEHQSVKDVPERRQLFARNQRWCHQKWGRWVRMAWPQPDLPARDSPEMRRWLERLIGWARRRVHVYVYCPVDSEFSSRALFAKAGLIPHADVRWINAPRPWIAWFRILQRQKKRFDIIVAPDECWANLARATRWIHRASVVAADNEQQLTEQWKKCRLVP